MQDLLRAGLDSFGHIEEFALDSRMKATAEFISEFATAAETFLVSVLETEGWKAEIIPEPTTAQK